MTAIIFFGALLVSITIFLNIKFRKEWHGASKNAYALTTIVIFAVGALAAFFMPAKSEANLSYTKSDVIWLAEKEKKEMKFHLQKASDICVYIPNLNDQRHTKNFLFTAIVSAPVLGVKEKFLTLSLAMICSLLDECHDKYISMQQHLYSAAYHMEMYNFYNSLSLHVACDKKIDSGTKAIFEAIDCLTLCDMMSACVTDEDVRDCLSNLISEQRNVLIATAKKPVGKLNFTVYAQSIRFAKNIYYTCEEIDEESLKEDILLYAASAVESIAQACRELDGHDCWPDLSFMRFQMCG